MALPTQLLRLDGEHDDDYDDDHDDDGDDDGIGEHDNDQVDHHDDGDDADDMMVMMIEMTLRGKTCFITSCLTFHFISWDFVPDIFPQSSLRNKFHLGVKISRIDVVMMMKTIRRRRRRRGETIFHIDAHKILTIFKWMLVSGLMIITGFIIVIPVTIISIIINHQVDAHVGLGLFCYCHSCSHHCHGRHEKEEQVR